MYIRSQLTVASPLTAGDITGALSDTITGRDRSDEVRAALAVEFDANEIVLTDSGTSALVLALRLLARPGVPVAMPAYACVDLIAAARRANVRIRLFDIDPQTLSPDMDSLERVLADGVSALVVAHLYGFPADMIAVTAAARRAGVPVIEDAAQHACATLGGKPAGQFGDVTVLSFGRGKGTTSGRGGALLRGRATAATVPHLEYDLRAASSVKDLVVAAATWMLGRPSIYGIPASIPALHLGETVYHEAGEPRGMSRAASAVLSRTLPGMHRAAAARRANALILRDAADQSRSVMAPRAVEGGESGYLRFPVVLRGDVHDDHRLGIARGYPRPLSREPEIQPCITLSDEPLHGANELARQLVTLPTHHMVTPDDIAATSRWLQEA
jgi:dTDP-4-amino-4,6-dideoxygalactose transaminase